MERWGAGPHLRGGGETYVRIVVPVDRHTQVLRLAHSTFTGGHFSHKKTSAVMKKLFTWPGVGRDVQNWVPYVHVARRLQSIRVPKPL